MRTPTRANLTTSVLAVLAAATLPLAAPTDSRATEAPAGECRPLVTKLVEQQIASYAAAARSRHMQELAKARDSELARAPRVPWAPVAPPAPAAAPAAEPPMPDPAPSSASVSAREADAAGAGAGDFASERKGLKAERAAGARKDATGPQTYSRTNTQEESVDEGDIVKTDGRTIYHVSCNRDREASGCRNELRIYSSWPARETKLLARYEIPAREGAPAVRQIYLFSGTLAVLMGESSRTGARTAAEISRLERGELEVDPQLSRLIVLDVSRPEAPRITRETLFDGALIDSRMIGSRLYLATSSPALRLPAAMVQEIHTLLASNRVRADASEVIQALAPKWGRILREMPGLPRAREVSASWDGDASKPVYSCADLDVADTFDGGRLLNLAQVDLSARGGNVTGAGVHGYGPQSTVYASEGAWYVADPTVTRNGRWQSTTMVRKFELGRGGKPKFEAAGVVRGTVLNQFAMSEHHGYLRVATSDGWSGNNLFVLGSSGGRLETVGSLENLATNERIYAVRMMGDRGYVVTFRRTDPLYTLDLSDPRSPRLVGELHIEGFSNYLHPLGRGHLLAVGQDADQFGRTLGFHLQIFDVSDPSRPVRKFHQKLDGGSTSDSQADHHAFMFEPATNTLSVPWKSESYWGLVAYRVDPREGFVDLGRVNHALMYKQFFRKECARAATVECRNTNHWWTFVTRQAIAVDRVIAIEDQLYSLSPSGLMVHRAGDRLIQTRSVLVSVPSWRSRAGAPVAALSRGWVD